VDEVWFKASSEIDAIPEIDPDSVENPMPFCRLPELTVVGPL